MLSDNPRVQAFQLSSIAIGLLLVGGFLFYQGFLAPEQVRGAEVTHNEEVQTQLQTLRNAIVAAADGGSEQSIAVSLGTRYPSSFGNGPQEATGRLRTVGTDDPAVNVSLSNVAVAGETGDYLNGTRAYPTGMVVYRPQYSAYESAPATVFEHSVLYSIGQTAGASEGQPGIQRGSNVSLLSRQALVSGTDISLLVVDGSLDRQSAGSTSVRVRPARVSTRTITVTNSTEGPVTLTMPTLLSRAEWLRAIREETTSYGGHVAGVSTRELPGRNVSEVSLELDPDQEYEVTVTRVTLGEPTTDPGVRYLTPVDGTNVTVPEGETATVIVETRDGYHNPVGGVRVAAGDSAQEDVIETADDGRATFTFEAPDDVDSAGLQPATVNLSFVRSPARVDSFDPSTPANATVRLWIENTDGSRAVSNEQGVYEVDWRSENDQRIGGEAECSPARCAWDVGADPNGELDVGVRIGVDSETAVPVDFNVNDSSVATVDPSSGRLEEGNSVSTTVIPNGTGVVRIRAQAADRADTLAFRVYNASEVGPGQSLALLDGSERVYTHEGNTSRVAFEVENRSPNVMNIESIDFVDTSAEDVVGVQVWNLSRGGWASEAFFNVSTGTPGEDIEDGYVETVPTWRVGDSAILDNRARLEPGQRMRVRVSQFIDAGDRAVDMGGETVTMRINYQTGTGRDGSATVTVTLPRAGERRR